ncbi:MAG: hypothetical protein ABI255_09705 [Microbacteriaceae bacterium]
MTEQTPQLSSALQRALAYLAAGLVLLSLAAIVAVIIGTAAGVGPNDGFSQGIWPVLLVLPLIALPLGFVSIITLLIVSAVRRSRMNRDTKR